MKVQDVMTKDVIRVTPETKIREVADILFTNRFHGVPVVEGGKIVGIITETDFFTKDAANFFLPTYIDLLKKIKVHGKLSAQDQGELDSFMETRAGDIMTKGCVTIYQDMDLHALLHFFKETKFTTLPVVDESEKLVGIATLSDLIGLMRL